MTVEDVRHRIAPQGAGPRRGSRTADVRRARAPRSGGRGAGAPLSAA
ncbi:MULTISPECIES: hypothetical protein [Streptomyces]